MTPNHYHIARCTVPKTAPCLTPTLVLLSEFGDRLQFYRTDSDPYFKRHGLTAWPYVLNMGGGWQGTTDPDLAWHLAHHTLIADNR